MDYGHEAAESADDVHEYETPAIESSESIKGVLGPGFSGFPGPQG